MIKRKQTLLAYFYLAWTLIIAGIGTGAWAQSAPITTAVTDTIYRADGTAATGTVLISWPAFTLASGASIPAGSKSVTLNPGGALSVNLVANAGLDTHGQLLHRRISPG